MHLGMSRRRDVITEESPRSPQPSPRDGADPYRVGTCHSETEMRLKMGSRLGGAGVWGGPNTPASKTGESDPPRLLPLLP